MDKKNEMPFMPEESGMENITNHIVTLGRKIYSLRMAKHMSQEQLAAVLSISPAAVSKWERNLSNPSIEMLWVLADFFECTIDELVGRTLIPVKKVGAYDQKKLRLMAIGEDLLKCSEVSRTEGLLAMESCIPGLKSGSRFLAFAIPYVMSFFMEQLAPEAFNLLENYVTTLPEAERPEGNMIIAALRKIFAGESPKILQELIASYIGMDYRERKGKMDALLVQEHSREEILAYYNDKKMASKNTNLLENFINVGDFEIQLTLRSLDEATLTAALAGASGAVVKAFLSNLSDRLLYLIHEDMQQWDGTKEDILSAQRKVLEIGNFCFGDAKRETNP